MLSGTRRLGALVVFASLGLAEAQPRDPAARDWIQLFNGRDLADWTIKFAKHDLGENLHNTFRVEDGLLKVRYDQWPSFNGEFGHIFYKEPFSYYLLAAEYRFVGEQVAGAPALGDPQQRPDAAQPHPRTMLKDQDFPISLEIQLLGGLGQGPRTTANLCTPGSHVVYNGQAPHGALHQLDVADLRRRPVGARRGAGPRRRARAPHRRRADGARVPRSRRSAAATSSPVDPAVKVDGTPMTGGYISLQAETAPIDFRKVELLNLEGCTDPKAPNYKSYIVKSEPGDVPLASVVTTRSARSAVAGARGAGAR